jgi:hypothetical protein
VNRLRMGRRRALSGGVVVADGSIDMTRPIDSLAQAERTAKWPA